VVYPLSDSDFSSSRVRHGRGALSNVDGRFEPYARAAVDDGWGSAADHAVVKKTPRR